MNSGKLEIRGAQENSKSLFVGGHYIGVLDNDHQVIKLVDSRYSVEIVDKLNDYYFILSGSDDIVFNDYRIEI